jgi:hypothetical protein
VEEPIGLHRWPIKLPQLRRPPAEEEELTEDAGDMQRAPGEEIEQEKPGGDHRGTEQPGTGGLIYKGMMMIGHIMILHLVFSDLGDVPEGAGQGKSAMGLG